MKTNYFTKLLTLTVVTQLFISCMAVPVYTNYNPYTSNSKINKVSMEVARSKISNILNENLKHGITVKDTLAKRPFSVKSVVVSNDGINFIGKKEQKKLLFSDIIDKSISGDGYSTTPFYIKISKLMTIGLVGDKNHTELMDYLYFIQRKLFDDQLNIKLKDFEPVAAAYRNLKMKPPVSEEQRKYIVQANALNEKKQYTEAVKLYVKAMKLDDTAYPSGYFNIALLDAQLGYYDNAIFEMKKYLMLVPDASDARSAQDKIYEWDINATE